MNQPFSAIALASLRGSFTLLLCASVVALILPGCDDLLSDSDSDGSSADASSSDAGTGTLDTSVQDTTTDELEDDWPEDWRQFEARVLELVNEERATGAVCGGEAYCSAPPLAMDPLLTAAARGHSRDMAELDFFDHDSPDGREFSDRIEEAGFQGPFPWGENIAAGYENPQQVVDGWMESPGHCRNIMDPDFGLLGVGYYFDDSTDMGSFWTQNFAGRN